MLHNANRAGRGNPRFQVAYRDLTRLSASMINATGAVIICTIWYLISRTVSEDDAHRGNTDDRSVRAFAVKPRAFGAPLGGVGA